MGTLNQACSRAYPPNRHLTCVRVAGHRGRHVWVAEDDGATSSTLTWRDHADGCGCCYCVDAPAARIAAEAVAP